jgi:hypothetical protein
MAHGGPRGFLPEDRVSKIFFATMFFIMWIKDKIVELLKL